MKRSNSLKNRIRVKGRKRRRENKKEMKGKKNKIKKRKKKEKDNKKLAGKKESWQPGDQVKWVKKVFCRACIPVQSVIPKCFQASPIVIACIPSFLAGRISFS